jgi:hypothetical protein
MNEIEKNVFAGMIRTGDIPEPFAYMLEKFPLVKQSLDNLKKLRGDLNNG